MSLIAAALQVFATGADALSVGSFINGVLRQEGQSAEALFTACFSRAINRHRPKLARCTDTKDANAVKVDTSALQKAVAATVQELQQRSAPADVAELVAGLCPLYRDTVILPGHQLTNRALDQQLAQPLEDALADFFTRLPAHPAAVARLDLAHITQVQHATHTQRQALDNMRDMLNQVLSRQEELLRKLPYLDPAVLQQESTRPEYRNPFRIVKAEDFNHDYDRLASLFREPSVYDDLRGPDNLIIAGGRGCGKSMLLRSLSALTAIQLSRLKAQRTDVDWRASGLDYFGVYIKLARGYFYEWSPDCKLTSDAATHLFQHVFNMLLLRALLEALLDARGHGVLRIDPHIEQGIVRQICEFAGFSIVANGFTDLLSHTRCEERHVAHYVGNLRLGTGAVAYAGSHTAIHDFMAFCCHSVVNSVPDLAGCRVFFLLDEYENLAEFQQRVVNTLAKLRPLSLSLKIATRALGVKSVVDLQGEPIQRPRDYHVVELDYDPSDAGYRQLLYDIASKRLEAEGFTNRDIKSLLLEAPRYSPAAEADVLTTLDQLLQSSGSRLAELERSARNEKLHHWSVALVFRLCKDRRQPFTYAGFDDFADLSSGIISSFLEFCKLAFYLAQAEGVDVRSGQAISWQTQNEAVYAASRAYFDYIERNVPETGAAISRLVLDLADVFREKLLTHGSEPESARLVIRDPGALESDQYRRLAMILDDAVRWSVFHAVGQASAYFPKHKTEVRSNDYLLNRVLAPILRISPRARWRCTFSADDLAGLVDQQTRSVVRNELRQKHGGRATSDPSLPDLPGLFDRRDIE